MSQGPQDDSSRHWAQFSKHYILAARHISEEYKHTIGFIRLLKLYLLYNRNIIVKKDLTCWLIIYPGFLTFLKIF